MFRPPLHHILFFTSLNPKIYCRNFVTNVKNRISATYVYTPTNSFWHIASKLIHDRYDNCHDCSRYQIHQDIGLPRIAASEVVHYNRSLPGGSRQSWCGSAPLYRHKFCYTASMHSTRNIYIRDRLNPPMTRLKLQLWDNWRSIAPTVIISWDMHDLHSVDISVNL